MMLKKTKIVASISDLRCDVDFIRDLFKAGMNVVRMNTAHAQPGRFRATNSQRTRSIQSYRYIDGYERTGSENHQKCRRYYRI